MHFFFKFKNKSIFSDHVIFKPILIDNDLTRMLRIWQITQAYFSKIVLFCEHANELRITSLSAVTLLFRYSFQRKSYVS